MKFKPLKALGLVFLLLTCFVSTARAQDSEYVSVENISELPDSVITTFLNESDSHIKKLLLVKYFYGEGYFNAQIELINDSVKIHKGCTFTFGQIEEVSNNSELNFSIKKGDRFSKNILKSELESIIVQFNDHGYLKARVDIVSIIPDLENCMANLKLNYEIGELAKLSRIVFAGAETNSQRYLTNLSRFRSSLVPTRSSLLKIQSELIGTELFDEVGYPEVFKSNGEYVLLLPVRERKLNIFDGIIGYVPDARGNAQLVGDVSLSIWNAFNQGNGLLFDYERIRPETSRLNLKVSQNWISNIPVGLEFGFNIYQNDSTYQARSFLINGFYWIDTGLKLIGGIGSTTSSSSLQNSLSAEPDGKKRFAKLGFEFSSVDKAEVPTQGFRLKTNFGVANKQYEIDSTFSVSQQFVEFNAENYTSISNKSVLAFSLNAFYLKSDAFTEFDLTRFGGANSLRGYAEEQLQASRMAWGDVEYRFLINPDSYLFSFAGLGNYVRPRLVNETQNNFSNNDFLYSIGVGISYATNIGRLKFTYALSPDESFGNGKVHIGIINRF